VDLLTTEPDLPPLPSDPAEAQRIEHTRLRRRMLYGLWAEDARARLRRALGTIRAEAYGEPDLSANPFSAVCSGVAALYDRDPRLGHEDAEAERAMRTLVESAQLWPLLQRVQRDTIGLREMVVRVDARVDDATGLVEVAYTPVPPDLVLGTADPERPGRPRAIRHAIRRQDPTTGRLVWTYDVWDVGGEQAVHRVLAAEGEVGADVSHLYGLPRGGLVGEAYPYRRADGRAVLPYVVYHAAATGSLWDPYYGSEIVEGTLDITVQWTLHGHVLRNAAWAQRWVMGAEIGGATVDGAGATARSRAVADPAVVLELSPLPEFSGQAQAGQWSTPTDPLAFAESITLRERRLVAYAGLAKSDVLRESGDPRSGYSLAVTREAQREAQRRYGPIFRPVDEQLVSVTATLANAAAGAPVLPEDGWTPSPQERQSEREDVLALVQARLMSPAEGRMRLFGETREEAVQALADLDPEPQQRPDPLT
jgi:hypothetical protein